MIEPVTADGILVTPYSMAKRFIGLREHVGKGANPLVLAMLQMDNKWVEDDETPWCSAFVNAVLWLLDLPRSKSLAARSWLPIGVGIPLGLAESGFDVVVLSRGSNPGAGHVGFYAGHSMNTISLLGGNQGDAVSVAAFDRNRVIGIRRLRPALPHNVVTPLTN